MSRLCVEITDRYGTVAHILDPDKARELRPRQRNRLGELVPELIHDVAQALGTDEDYARWVIVASLARLVADEEAYERVAERRGLLPL